MRKITCCSVTDDHYLMQTEVTIYSVCINNQDCKVEYYLLYTGSIKESQSLSSVLSVQDKCANLELHIVLVQLRDLVDSGLVAKLNETLKLSRLTIASYVRLFLPQILPNVSKILYLDSDVVCLSDLSELFELNLETVPVIGVKDVESETHKRRLCLKRYINSGVLMINLTYWREKKVLETFCKIINNRSADLHLHDQDVINLAFDDHITLVSEKWNFHGPMQKYIQIDLNDVSLLHFVAEHKPWIKGNMNPVSDIWVRYYKGCFNCDFEYHEYFPLSIRILNMLSQASRCCLPLGSKRREACKLLLKFIFTIKNDAKRQPLK